MIVETPDQPSLPMGRPPASSDPFRAIADPHRRAMLDAVLVEERTVADLTRMIGTSQPTISQHMAILREAGLVAERREGRRTFYRARPERLAEVRDWIAKYEVFWEARLGALEAHLGRRRN